MTRPGEDPGPPSVPPRLRTALLTSLALVAFAANSVLCRIALGGGTIDAASFGSLRLASGAATLALIHAARRDRGTARRSRLAPAMLFVYVAGFSFAYTSLPTGTGALLLFGAVQATMILFALRSGERVAVVEIAGLALALTGLVYLVLPGFAAPSPLGAALMVTAGIAWGVYSLCGRDSRDATADTARNFAVATPLALLVSLALHDRARADLSGILLAVCSGAVTSGLGYAVWFAAMRGLTAVRAATVQLVVPALAAAGGVLFLSEELTLRLVVAGALILGGVGVAIAGRARRARRGAGPASPPGPSTVRSPR